MKCFLNAQPNLSNNRTMSRHLLKRNKIHWFRIYQHKDCRDKTRYASVVKADSGADVRWIQPLVAHPFGGTCGGKMSGIISPPKLSRNTTIGVVGLGYVGLPLAIELGKNIELLDSISPANAPRNWNLETTQRERSMWQNSQNQRCFPTPTMYVNSRARTNASPIVLSHIRYAVWIRLWKIRDQSGNRGRNR